MSRIILKVPSSPPASAGSDPRDLSSEKVLVLGATGLLGQAMLAQGRMRGWACIGAARSRADHIVDVTDHEALSTLVREISPSVVVNCAANTSHEACESDPGGAYAINARTASVLAELSFELDSRLVHISSDHFFTGNGAALHSESAPVRLLNEYARSKYAGEAFALTAPASLVVRTNFVGLRGWRNRPSFAEWALDAIEQSRPIVLFDDYFTSSIHSDACAGAVLDLLQIGATGLINVASSEVASKRTFIEALATAANVELAHVSVASVVGLTPRRAESLGLDVARAERMLDRSLPNLDETVHAILDQHREPRCS